MTTSVAAPPLVSVVLCTWNRASLLEGALEALVAQVDPPPYEILVVDNASTDETREVVERFSQYQRLRYVYEATQGLSFARNTGVRMTTGAAVAFTDDDIRVPPRWLRCMAAALDRYPDAACMGGPVMPEWTRPAPSWLTEDRWTALGVHNYSAEPFTVDASRPVCLIGANLVIRREALETVGPFDPAVQRVGNGVGSTEDHEYHVRLWDAGLHGVYDPALRVSAVITDDRLAKRYHRRWHFGHGRHVARMRLADMERTRHRLFGVPAHVIRQAATDLVAGLAGVLTRDQARAFERELRLWFAAGFIRERLG